MALKPRTGIGSATAIYQMPVAAMPQWLHSYVDPVFGTNVTRVSDLIQDTSGSVGSFGMIYEYPPAVPISKNKTWIALAERASVSGSGLIAVYRMLDGARMSAYISPGSDREGGFYWSQTDDNVAYFRQTGDWFCKIEMPSGTITQEYRILRADNSTYSYVDPRCSGNLSFDNRWHCAHCYQYPVDPAKPPEWVMYDRLNNSVYARVTPPQYTGGLMITPYSGMAVAPGDTANTTCHTNLYDRNLNFVRFIFPQVSHGCFAMGSDGEEYFLAPSQTDYQITRLGWGGMTKVRLSDGLATRILGFTGCPNSAIHVSGNISYSHPGWFVMSHYSTALPTPFIRVGEHEVWLWNFETGEVRRIAHTHNDPEELITGGIGKDYWAETQATSSWDGNNILFKSNWMTAEPNKQVLTYMVTAPTGYSFFSEEAATQAFYINKTYCVRKEHVFAGANPTEVPFITKPVNFGDTYTDPTFGTTVKLIGAKTAHPDYPSGGQGFVHEYSRHCSINADKTRCVIQGAGGTISGRLYALDMSTGALGTYFTSYTPAGEPCFNSHPTDATYGYFRTGGSIKKYDFSSNTITNVMTPTDALGNAYAMLWPAGEGRFTNDMRYTAMWGSQNTSTYTPRDYLYLDLQAGTVLLRRNGIASGFGNWLGISPLGNYVVKGGDGGSNTDLYDTGFNYIARLHSTYSHGDLLIGADGEEYYVYDCNTALAYADPGVNHTSESVAVVRLRDQMRYSITALGNTNPSGSKHFSGLCSYSHPGWCLMETYGTRVNETSGFKRGMRYECMFLNIHSGAIKRVCHHHSMTTYYYGEPRATCSWDGNMVMFTSTWETSDNSRYEVYTVTGDWW